MPREPSESNTNVVSISTNEEIQGTNVEKVSARVRELASRHGLNASSLSTELAIPTSSGANYWSGKRMWPGELLGPLADRLQTTVDYILGRTADSGLIVFRGSQEQFDELARTRVQLKSGEVLPRAENDDQVAIASVDLAYGFGGAFLDADNTNVEQAWFSRTWLRAQGIHAPPEFLGVAQGIGDSMEPVFYDRDLLFFDRSARLEDHLGDKMWVFAYGQIGMVKRLRLLPDGTVKIMSANRTYPDEIATEGELHIIGRVVGSWRSY